MSVVDAETHIKNVDAFARVLSSATAGDQICQWLVTNWLSPYQPLGANLFVIRHSGDLEMVGVFGFPDDLYGDFRKRKIWEGWPITDAARDGKQVAVNGHDEIHANYPNLAAYLQKEPLITSIVAQPVLINELPVGVFSVVSSKVLTKRDIAAMNLGLLASIVALRLSDVGFGSNGLVIAPNANGQEAKDMLGKPLTERQRLILQLICEGKTNPLIAYTLGYSESTVRQESMKIYRKLGVANRTAAAELIKSRGLESLTK